MWMAPNPFSHILALFPNVQKNKILTKASIYSSPSVVCLLPFDLANSSSASSFIFCRAQWTLFYYKECLR